MQNNTDNHQNPQNPINLVPEGMGATKCLSFQVGNEISINEIARIAKTDAKTTTKYLDLLEKSLFFARSEIFRATCEMKYQKNQWRAYGHCVQMDKFPPNHASFVERAYQQVNFTVIHKDNYLDFLL